MRRQLLFYFSIFTALFLAQACGKNFFNGVPIGACAEVDCYGGYDAPGQTDDGSNYPGDDPGGTSGSSGSSGGPAADTFNDPGPGWVGSPTGFNGEMEYFDAEGMKHPPMNRRSQVVKVVPMNGGPEF